jgi:flagellar L-ring protein precursor FlgH
MTIACHVCRRMTIAVRERERTNMMMSLTPPVPNRTPAMKSFHTGVTMPKRPSYKPEPLPLTSSAAMNTVLGSIYRTSVTKLPSDLAGALNRCVLLVCMLLSVFSLVSVAWYSQAAQAESLFKPLAIGLAAPALSTPRMLYSPPKPAQVGDLVTILVREKVKRQNVSQVQIKKTQANGTNAPQAVNTAVEQALDVVGVGGLAKFARIPSLPSITTDNNLQSQANLNQTSEYTDSISCQVVQVLPNGNLVVQGRKANLMAKERTDTYVTGIINPYFLDSENQIDSSKVANLQVMASGQGVMSRGQGDGLLNKIIQFFQ